MDLDGKPELRERLIRSVFRIRSLTLNFHSGENAKMASYGISIAELTAMSAVRYNSKESSHNIGISELQNLLFTTKGAVSKMLGVLDRKGFVNRDLNPNNRRELIVTLTGEGSRVLKELENDSDNIMDKIIARLGDEQAQSLIETMNRFADTLEEAIRD